MADKVRAGLGGRLPLLSRGELQPAQTILWDAMEQGMGGAFAERAGFAAKDDAGHFIGPFNPMLYSPAMGEALQTFQLAEAKGTSLTERIRQVVILAIGSVWQAPYELYAHAAAARAAGLSDEAITHLKAGSGDPSLDEREAAALEVAIALTRDRHVDDATYDHAEAVLGRTALVDLAVLAGCYDLVCSILNLFAVPSPPRTAPPARNAT